MSVLRNALRPLSRGYATQAPRIVDGFVGAVGNTPLIRLKHASDEVGANIYAKAEFMSPGGSIKDRAALYLVTDAEAKGQLRAGGTVVEGTAGNTGIGLAHVCRARGYKCVIYMPDTQSQEKIDLLRMLGADVRPVPAVAFDNEMNYNHQARRYAESLDNAVWTNQFDNTANRGAHIVSTGPEIWEQTGGKLDAFVCATGTGGTLAGVTRYLVEKSEGRVESYLADPPGSVLYNLVENGKLAREGTGSITEGIGQGRVTDNLKPDLELLSGAVHVPDAESIRMVYRLLAEEGLYVGASSALNVWAAQEIAKKKGKGSTVVTARLFSRVWLESKGLLEAIPENLRSFIVLP
ncbi:unnamed protein product [Cutaneotrichosporon oleaginosum]